MADWETDRVIVKAGVELLNLCVLASLKEGLDSSCLPWVDAVAKLAKDFGDEPDQMGAATASIWQDRAIELTDPNLKDHGINKSSEFVVAAALQLAAIVNELAARQGGIRNHRFGFATLRVGTTVYDRASHLEPHPMANLRLDPRDMLDFIVARARNLQVAPEDIIAKTARRGL